ncbi:MULTISPECIES: VirD4-like conjugal transfer protein, CD1115 family [Bacillus]|uniref:VirD4-like conjugal transfer protein, CD1115 family n=1 Tax=Bacillus amyloliquefaciens group TaxID=1938374 RepID=UPI0039DFD06D
MSDNQLKKNIFTEKQVLIPLGICIFFGLVLVANFMLQLVLQLVNSFSDLSNPPPIQVSSSNFFKMPIADHPFFYLLVFLVGALLVLKLVFEIRTNFKTVGEDEKGSQRFSTDKELKKQYKSVPLKTAHYKGGGGVVISRTQKYQFTTEDWETFRKVQGMKKVKALSNLVKKKDFLLVDDGPVNNLIIGTTRSGKGETFVFPTIDVYSRAQHKPSLIVNDPKGELFTASKETLEKRGYHIEVLNLLDQEESMSYNLLQLIKDAYQSEDYSTAQMLCKTLSYSLYYNPKDSQPFWAQSAMSLCNALILAVVDKCIKEKTEEKITMYTVANMLSELGSRDEQIYEDEEPQNMLDLYFQNLPAGNIAKAQYATSNFSKGSTRGGIFATAMSKLDPFTFDSTAKLTAKNSVDLKKVGFGKSIEGTGEIGKRVVIRFPNNKEERVKVQSNGRWILTFKYDLKIDDLLRIDGKTYRITNIDPDTGDTDFEFDSNNAKTDSQLEKITYFTKPIAIFMVTPDFDESNHVIASIFIRQLYFVLAKNANLSRGGKCHREVIFLLDEFGNMPAIEGMSNIITVCLGRNIRFNLIIQAYSQLKQKYGDDSDTIIGNCGNQIYILTTDKNTANHFSEMLGDQTHNVTSRSGKALSTEKSNTENVDGRRLLTPNELMELREGETVVIRGIKRQDNNRDRVRPRPIFNTESTAMKYRWEYLNDDFDTSKSILDIDIKSQHRNVNPKDLLLDFSDSTQDENNINDNDDINNNVNKIDEESNSSVNSHLSAEKEVDGQPNVSKEPEKYEQPPTEINADSPFVELSVDNWRVKTVGEFFDGENQVFSLIYDQISPHLLDDALDSKEIQSMEMGIFFDQLKILATNDHITKPVYGFLHEKVRKKISMLKEKAEKGA